MRNYQKTTYHLKHRDSWYRASAERRGELEIKEMVLEQGSSGLVLVARGVVMQELPIRIGNRYEMRPAIINVTWSFNGKCTDWRHHRLFQYDLVINETAEERKASIANWESHSHSEQPS